MYKGKIESAVAELQHSTEPTINIRGTKILATISNFYGGMFRKLIDIYEHPNSIYRSSGYGMDFSWKTIIKLLCSEAVSIELGVRQDWVLSPLLFNKYSEQIFIKALEEADEGILLNR